MPEIVPPLKIWETEDRYDHRAMWQQVDGAVSGRTAINSYMETFGPDATDIIENMVGNLGKPFYVNTLNRGAVTNMADDAFLELLCDMRYGWAPSRGRRDAWAAAYRDRT
ncbi:MAG: hypothetical protein R2932_46195 [Caldilineaceae bacterium]